jgi:hypothetical protein
MVAKLRKKIDGNYYCSNCMMGQPDLESNCFYCGAVFSNWEEIQFQLQKEYEEEEIRNDTIFLKSDGRK